VAAPGEKAESIVSGGVFEAKGYDPVIITQTPENANLKVDPATGKVLDYVSSTD
jgi:hypothetical protein